MIRFLQVLGFIPVGFLIACAPDSPCPSGQELRQEWHEPEKVRARGCVWVNADGIYRREGRWEFFFASGQKEGEGRYKDAFAGGETGITGILMDGRHGSWVFWYENGQKSSDTRWINGKLEGFGTQWHENGQKKFESTFLNDKREGAATWWHENGRKRQEATFRNDEIATETKKTWDDSGTPIQ